MKFVIIIGHSCGIVPADPVAGKFRPIKTALRFNLKIYILINSSTNPDLQIISEIGHLPLNLLNTACIGVRIQAVHIKSIPAGSSGNKIRTAEHRLDAGGKFFQNTVSDAPTAHLINQMKMFDVENDRIHSLSLPETVCIEPFDIFKEKIAGVQTGQFIIFG